LLFLWGSKYKVKRIVVRTRTFLSYVVHLKGFSPYIYWPIVYIPKPLFVRLFKVARITYIYWPIDCTQKLSFVRVFEVARITYIYWPIECTSKLLFARLFEVARIPYIYS